MQQLQVQIQLYMQLPKALWKSRIDKRFTTALHLWNENDKRLYFTGRNFCVEKKKFCVEKKTEFQ